jgi:type VI secretion system protein ImpL
MKIPSWLRPAGVSRLQEAALLIAYAVLAVWAVGLAVAAMHLGDWRQQLTRTLMQLNADAQFRARANNREAVDPEWYRRKALALLDATDRVQQDAAWSLFVPGSWTAFDSLEEQLEARLSREFSEIVVETMRRELYARASRLTGVALVRGTGDLQTASECQSPVPQTVERKLASAPEDLPEFVAVADYVAGVERLDDAVQSFLSLQYSSGQPEQLRKLVAYTLDKELPGALASSVRMFQAGEEVNIQPALMQSRLQWATRCSLAKAMTALHTRLLNTNDLFALEQGLAERSTGLFDPNARPMPFERTLERYRAVHALLADQHTLLAMGRNDWMRQGSLQLGPSYQAVLQRIERTRLLGPEVVHQLNSQSGAAFAEFRRQFEAAFGSQGAPGIVWLEDEKRFGLSPDRSGVRQGLAALLKTSFMAEEAASSTGKGGKEVIVPLGRITQDARALADERARARAEIVPLFPAQAQLVVSRVVDARVSDVIYQRAFRTLKASVPADPQAPLDQAAFKQQRDQVTALQAILKETGAPALGERLMATLDGELLRRLALVQEEWQGQPLQDARMQDFSWWQGEPLPLAAALSGPDAVPAQPALSRTAARLDLLVQRAKVLLALGSPALATHPAAANWLQLQGELERYAARATDSSLLRLERYVTALGPDFHRENCGERLAANPPAAAHEDAIAVRHAQLHAALAARCSQLRAQTSAPPATVVQ